MFCLSCFFFGGALHLHNHAFAVWSCELPQVRVASETLLSHTERIMYSQVASHYVWCPASGIIPVHSNEDLPFCDSSQSNQPVLPAGL